MRVLARRPALPGRQVPFVLFGICALPLLLWWVAFYPGLISGDSVGYTLQIVTGQWTSDYSVTYTALLWLSYRLTGDIALLVLVQALGFAAALAYAATGVRRLGTRWRWAGGVTLLLCLTPMVGAFASYLSKDAAFVAAQLFAFGALARVVARRAAPTALLAQLVAAFLLMSLFRNNGAPMVLLAALLVAVALGRLGLRVLAAAGVALLAWALLSFAVFPALGVHRAKSSLVLGTAYDDVAYAYQHFPKTFNGRDLALMASVSPLKHWRAADNCYTSDQLNVTPAWDQAASEAKSSQLFALWRSVLRRTPQAVVDARVCRGAIAWMPFPPKSKATALVPVADAPPPDLADHAAELPAAKLRALKPHPPSVTLGHAAEWAEKVTFGRTTEFLLWRGATWAWLSYLLVGLLARRRVLSWRLGVPLVAVTVANQVGVFVDNPNQLARYMFGCLVIGVLLLPLLAVPRRTAARSATIEE